jgi:regulator of replication initiation timing
VDGLRTEVGSLRAEVDGLRTEVGSLRAEVDGLRTEVGSLRDRMDKLEPQMDKQYQWLQRLGAEFIEWRAELKTDIRQLRTEMQDGFRRLTARIDLTDGTVVLMASVLRRPTELGEELERHLGALEAR